MLYVGLGGDDEVVLEVERFDATILPVDGSGRVQVAGAQITYPIPINLSQGEYAIRVYGAEAPVNATSQETLCLLGNMMDTRRVVADAPLVLHTLSIWEDGDRRRVAEFAGLGPANGFYVLNVVFFSLVDGSVVALTPLIAPAPGATTGSGGGGSLWLAVCVPLFFALSVLGVGLGVRVARARGEGKDWGEAFGSGVGGGCGCCGWRSGKEVRAWKFAVEWEGAVEKNRVMGLGGYVYDPSAATPPAEASGADDGPGHGAGAADAPSSPLGSSSSSSLASSSSSSSSLLLDVGWGERGVEPMWGGVEGEVERREGGGGMGDAVEGEESSDELSSLFSD